MIHVLGFKKLKPRLLMGRTTEIHQHLFFCSYLEYKV